jgi:ABC-type sulfate/molybdate transport systems ATPase subunit
MMPVTPAVLEFDQVTVRAALPDDAELHEATLTLRAGELVRVSLAPPRDVTLVADLAQGLLTPDGGTVRFLGQDWCRLTAAAAARQRRLIGRVFKQQAWINNLDVDENVLLARRHYGDPPWAELCQQADTLARRFGLDGLPARRPDRLSPATLRLAQWVRALLGDKHLLILENALRDVPVPVLPALSAALADARAAGSAVLWLSDRDDAAPADPVTVTVTVTAAYRW